MTMTQEKTASAVQAKRSLRDYGGLVLRGMAMGASDIVPGVSGGTMAFILGIYEELIQSIRDIASPDVIRAVFGFKIKTLFTLINWQFLFAVAGGILLAAITLSSVLESLLINQPVYIWSFFFGLVVASVWAVRRRIERWRPRLFVFTVAGAAGAFWLVGLVPAQTPDAPWFLFLCGAIAICAMVLPGVSGAFMLVLLGKYQFILNAVNNRDFVTILLVGAGAAIGIVTFAQLLSWLFRTHHEVTIALLVGLMIGSLRKIWPWKVDLEWLTDEAGQFVLSDGHRIVTLQENVLPTLSGNGLSEIGIALALAALGCLLILVLDHFANRKQVDTA